MTPAADICLARLYDLGIVARELVAKVQHSPVPPAFTFAPREPRP